MTSEQREHKLAKQRECMRRQRERMTPAELEAKRRANRENMRRARAERPEEARAAYRRYDEAHPEQKAYRRFCRYHGNRDGQLSNSAAWKAANPDRNRELNRESAKRCATRPANKAAALRKSRRRHLHSVKDKAALGQRIAAAAQAVARSVDADLRQEIINRLVEGVYSGRFPVRLKPEHAAEVQREHFRQFSKFDAVSLDDVLGENGFTRGHAMGVY